MYLKSSDCDDGRRKLEAFVWEKQLLPPSHACMVFHKILVNSKIFKLSLYLSLTHLRAQIACYELKGELSPVMLKEIFDESFENFEITRTKTRSTTSTFLHVVFPEDVTQYAFFSTARSMFTEGPENKSVLKVSEMAEKLDAENILLVTDSYKVRW